MKNPSFSSILSIVGSSNSGSTDGVGNVDVSPDGVDALVLRNDKNSFCFFRFRTITTIRITMAINVIHEQPAKSVDIC